MLQFNKQQVWIAILSLTIIGVSILSFTSGEKNEFPSNFPHDYKIITPYIPENISFCGEEAPLNNIDVRERFEREIIANTYRHSATIMYLKRANRWFPVIEPILKKYNIPDDIKYLSVAESGLENVKSPAGALGFWQFMKSAGKKHGLEINKEVDERFNVEKATVAACKYLQESFDKYHSWTMAAASYNMGTNGASNQLERQKVDNNYYNLILNNETERYVFRIMALKTVMENPKVYGFDIPKEELFPQYSVKKVKINHKVDHFADFAKSYGINYRILKLFNPWLRQNYLKNKKRKTYIINIPTESTKELFGL